jgi:hypothetical protein
LERLSYEPRHGMSAHPTLAVSESGIALGVLEAWMWVRKPKGEVDMPESLRWLEGYERAAELEAPLAGMRAVCSDREGDIRALLDRGVALAGGYFFRILKSGCRVFKITHDFFLSSSRN